MFRLFQVALVVVVGAKAWAPAMEIPHRQDVLHVLPFKWSHCIGPESVAAELMCNSLHHPFCSKMGGGYGWESGWGGDKQSFLC